MCRRRQLKAMLSGDIAAVGRNYAVTLQAIDCESGDAIAREFVEVPRKEDVLGAVGRATTVLRERLGESLASIHRLDTPIEQATTSSLEALKAFAQADRLRAQGKRPEALSMFLRAIEIDGDFALATERKSNSSPHRPPCPGSFSRLRSRSIRQSKTQAPSCRPNRQWARRWGCE